MGTTKPGGYYLTAKGVIVNAWGKKITPPTPAAKPKKAADKEETAADKEKKPAAKTTRSRKKS